jgi:hypothetical protein
MWPLGYFFDKLGWAVFNPWALAHGSALIAWPIFGRLIFYALNRIRWFKSPASITQF